MPEGLVIGGIVIGIVGCTWFMIRLMKWTTGGDPDS